MKKILFFLLISISGFSQVKISDMPAATSLTGTEIVPIVQGGINKKATVSLWPNNTIVVSSNTTAVNDAVYTVVASATFTDPSPVEGKGFTVFIRNGTGTVGGTGYSVAGTQIRRIFHSGSWANYVGGGDMVLASTQTNTGLKTFLDGTLGMRNVANTFTSQFTNTNTAARTYTLPNWTGNVVVASGDLNDFNGGGFSYDDGVIGSGKIEFNPFTGFVLKIYESYGLTGNASQMDFIGGGGIQVSSTVSGFLGMTYNASYSSAILANDRSIPDIGTIKSGAFTSTGKKTFSVTGNIAGINAGANATDPTTTLAAGDLYYQTGVGLRVYSGSSWSTLGAGGGSTYYAPTTLVANATDANFTATVNGVHNILDGVASANRVITIPTGANGDVMKFYNTEDTRVWSFTGATVYLADRVTVVTELLYNVPCHMERIDGRWIITN